MRLTPPVWRHRVYKVLPRLFCHLSPTLEVAWAGMTISTPNTQNPIPRAGAALLSLTQQTGLEGIQDCS